MTQEKGLEALHVWQKAITFTIRIQRELIPLLPVEEKWSLSSQLRRAVQSIPANIAEGHGRYYYQEGVHYCYIARGSLEEVFTQIYLARELGYLSRDLFDQLNKDAQELRRLSNGYIIYLKKSKRGENEPGYTPQIHESSIPYLPASKLDDAGVK